MARRARLDAELVRRGLARSREHAAELVAAGRVEVRGGTATKPATSVDPADAIRVLEGGGVEYASRGGHKLAGALAAFPALTVEGKRCLDAGASTGGFTDVLLRAGAARVVAVDVGYGQLVWALRTDDRVQVHDRTNVRTLTPEDIGGQVDLTVADLSFISLRLVLPALAACTLPDGDLVPMVKPQFEVGKDRVGTGGVVRDPKLHAEVVLDVAASAAELGLGVAGVGRSPLPGPSGNIEFFLWLRRGAPPVDPAEVARVVGLAGASPADGVVDLAAGESAGHAGPVGSAGAGGGESDVEDGES
ncbi:TlyA family rRNA (cytidine-2'-O)-methyltransferase [Longispora fulva]|uniref:23S rRNA (Cytidine1920-2'-O)/16S rRNA (Cytidine1409-2'-O)-methyltransferase n=1 Tax=Longispora fulva TaxID=619741 RepID=A0A8J7GLL8_9ACTN|nr:TlyA family RNA methyltransferase [Longispora fulva]MBG6133813.1 23S rRNA (cytidine1920-2'-O)/16S rRNA (cytidine1409-2'-O)-methyltransferase [Longispora fulva]GIG62852.1 TlyA family rRNA (cytidine-2'-O)-methyltransferase [Longispora fulva]